MRRIAAVVMLGMVVAQPALADSINPIHRDFVEDLLRSIIWLVVAGLMFVIAFKVVDLTTPGNLKEQLAEGNSALAIYVAGLAIAIAIIIAALI